MKFIDVLWIKNWSRLGWSWCPLEQKFTLFGLKLVSFGPKVDIVWTEVDVFGVKHWARLSSKKKNIWAKGHQLQPKQGQLLLQMKSTSSKTRSTFGPKDINSSSFEVNFWSKGHQLQPKQGQLWSKRHQFQPKRGQLLVQKTSISAQTRSTFGPKDINFSPNDVNFCSRGHDLQSVYHKSSNIESTYNIGNPTKTIFSNQNKIRKPWTYFCKPFLLMVFLKMWCS